MIRINRRRGEWALSLRDLEALKRFVSLLLCADEETVGIEALLAGGCVSGGREAVSCWGPGMLLLLSLRKSSWWDLVRRWKADPRNLAISPHRICCPPSVWATRATPKHSPAPFRASINASPADLNMNPVWKYLCNVTGLVRCASHMTLGEEMRTSRSRFALTPLHSLRVIARKMDALLKLWNTSGRFYGVTPTSALTLIWQ